MNRRKFLEAVGALPLALCIPLPSAPHLRPIYRIVTERRGRWIWDTMAVERVRMSALKKGNRFYFGDDRKVCWQAVEDGESRPAPEFGSILAEKL